MPRAGWPRSTRHTRRSGPVPPGERANQIGMLRRPAALVPDPGHRKSRAPAGRHPRRRRGRSRPASTRRTSSGRATRRRRRPAVATDTGRGHLSISGERRGARRRSREPPIRRVRSIAFVRGVRLEGRRPTWTRPSRLRSCSASSTVARWARSPRWSGPTWNGWNGRSPATRTSWLPPGSSSTGAPAILSPVTIPLPEHPARPTHPARPAPRRETRAGTPIGVPAKRPREGPRDRSAAR